MSDIDKQPLSFGKHVFKTPEEVADIDPSYVVWLYENVNPKVVSRSLYQACEMDIAENEYAQDFAEEY